MSILNTATTEQMGCIICFFFRLLPNLQIRICVILDRNRKYNIEDGGNSMAKMTVYHGGYTPVKHPEIRAGRNTKDFGTGFYCTVIKEQAQRWAKRYDDKIVSIYIDGAITREQFWVLAKFKYPTHQINFCTREALKCLEYRGYEETR